MTPSKPAFHGDPHCQHCGHYASVNRRTRDQGWHRAGWGECRKDDPCKTGKITVEDDVCESFTPDPRRWEARP